MLAHQSSRNRMLYAHLLDDAHSNILATGRGLSFSSKCLKGRRYWYLSVAVGRARRQTYLGPDTPEVHAHMEHARTQWSHAKGLARERRQMVTLLAASGAASTPIHTGTGLSLLAESGIFQTGAVLTGSLTYSAYANHLGLHWPGSATIAPERIGLALDPDRFDWAALKLRHAGLYSPAEAMLSKEPATRNTGSGEHIDVFTPSHPPQENGPVFINSAGVYAHPIPHLEYLLAHTQPAVLLVHHGIPVHVPQPARFALHALALPDHHEAQAWSGHPVYRTRLLEALVQETPGTLRDAFTQARQHSEAFHARLLRAFETLPETLGAQLSMLAEACA